MLTKEQVERIIADAIHHDDGNTSPATVAAEKIAGILEEDSQILVTAQALENEVTGTLMDMLAAYILASLIENGDSGRANIRFSATGMKETLKRWTFTTKLEGLERNVVIAPADNADMWDHLTVPGNGRVDPDAQPQAEPKPERPVWAVRVWSVSTEDPQPYLRLCQNRADAERVARAIMHDENLGHQVENRFCLHLDCPTTGCTHIETSEATS